MPQNRSSRLRSIRRLGRGGLLDLIEAQLLLLWAQLLVWTRPTGRLISPAPAGVPLTPGRVTAAEAIHLSRAVTRAAKRGVFRPSCLVCAVALQQMLESRGIQGGLIRVGVQRRNGRFLAHAWVDYRGLVLGDHAGHVRAFTPLSDFTMSSVR